MGTGAHLGTCLGTWALTQSPVQLSTCLLKFWCRSRWKLQVWVPRHLDTQAPNQAPTGIPAGPPRHPLRHSQLSTCLLKLWCRSRWKLEIWVPRHLGTQAPTGSPAGAPWHPLRYPSCLHAYWNSGVDLDGNSKSGYPGIWAPRHQLGTHQGTCWSTWAPTKAPPAAYILIKTLV